MKDVACRESQSIQSAVPEVRKSSKLRAGAHYERLKAGVAKTCGNEQHRVRLGNPERDLWEPDCLDNHLMAV